MPYKGQLSLPFYIWIIYLFAVVISDIILNQDFKKYNLLNNNIFLNHEIYYPFKKMITLFENKKILEGMDNAAVIETLIGDITEKYNQKCAIIARDYINFLKPGEISLIDGIDGIDGDTGPIGRIGPMGPLGTGPVGPVGPIGPIDCLFFKSITYYTEKYY